MSYLGDRLHPWLRSLLLPRTRQKLQLDNLLTSHRATVGASELQHFSPIDGWGALPAMDAGATVVVLPLTELSTQLFLTLLPSPRFSQQFFGPGLWFRPPPVR